MKISLENIFKKPKKKGMPVSPGRVVLDNELGELHDYARQLYQEKLELCQGLTWAIDNLSEFHKRGPEVAKLRKLLEEVQE
jgi:hypothetical protein